MNYFETKSTAERYSIGRPDFHTQTIERVKKYLQISNKLENALDIACGTGLSTKALLEISKNVCGTDLAIEMLNVAENKNLITYKVAPAEKQPFNDNFFDIVTVSSGVHWFNINDFLDETNRILKSKSWLVIYDNFFISEMQGVSEFSTWFSEIYCSKYPSPSRNDHYKWNEQNLEPKKFSLVKNEEFKNEIEFTLEKLILYFTTQSNIAAQIENSNTSYIEVENWLREQLKPFFKKEIRKINYGNWIKYLQKQI